MNKFHKFVTLLALAMTVGLTYAAIMIKGLPEAFDWEEDDE